MIYFPKRTYYAVEAVLYIAYNSTGMPISGKEIAERQKLPARYLEQMMQRLVRAGVLRGVRGPRGGYFLAKEKRRITIAEVCSVIDDGGEALPSSTSLGDKVVMPLMSELSVLMDTKMQEITLAQLCERAEALRLPKSNEEHHDFSI